MSTISELAPLMFRPRWTRFTLSSQVRRRRKNAGPDGPTVLTGGLTLAPGGRYRAELTDEQGDRVLTICNGQSSWVVSETSAFTERRTFSIPFQELLVPSWLLADFDLNITGQTEYSGRAAYIVVASPRETSKGRNNFHNPSDRVSALIDVELGILLQYKAVGPGERTEISEFSELHVDTSGKVDPMLFDPPSDVRFEDLRSNPHSSSVITESALGGTSHSISDDTVNLLYRSTLSPQHFSAELHERTDGKEIARSMRAAISSSALSWVGQLEKLAADYTPEAIDLTARLHVAMPGRYRVDVPTDPGSRPKCISCDGERMWRVFSDRVVIGPAAPPPAGIALLIDPAWLLHGYRLSADGATSVSGRPGLRVIAEKLGEPAAERDQGPLSGISLLADKIETIIDSRLGVALRQVWYLDGKLLLSNELSGITEDVDPATFRVEPPPELRIITSTYPLNSASLSAAARDIAGAASKLAMDIGRWMGRGSRH